MINKNTDQVFEETLPEQERKELIINTISKTCELVRLKYSYENSFLMVRLLPSAQYLLRLCSRMTEKPILQELFSFLDEWYDNLWKYFIRLTWGNYKSNSTNADRVLISNEIDPLTFISKMNQFMFCVEGKRFKSRLEEAYQTDIQAQIDNIEQRFHHFAEYLYSLLTNVHVLKETLQDYEERLGNQLSISKLSESIGKSRSKIPKQVTMSYIIQSLELQLNSDNMPENISQVQENIEVLFTTLLKQIVNEICSIIKNEKELTIPCAYAIVGFGSWGKGCVLPYHQSKILVILDQPLTSSNISEFYLPFCELLKQKCNEYGIIMNDDILCGDNLTIFVDFVTSGSQGKFDSKLTQKHLIKLCAMWDSKYLCGKQKLAASFKNTVSAILQSKDKLNVQPRSQQFVQAFFLYLQKEIEQYKTSTSSTSSSSSLSDLSTIIQSPINIRNIILNISKIINFISLYYDISTTNPWKRVETIKKFGFLSNELCDQIFCVLNISHTIYARGQLKYKTVEVTAYPPTHDNDNTLFVVDDIIEWEILVFAERKLIPNLATSLYQFSKWLEVCATPNPLLEKPPCSTIYLVSYYHKQALRFAQKNLDFDWEIVHKYCERALLHVGSFTTKSKYNDLDDLIKLNNQSETNAIREQNITNSFSSFIRTLITKSNTSIVERTSLEELEENAGKTLQELSETFLAIHFQKYQNKLQQNGENLLDENHLSVTKEKLQSIFTEWIKSTNFQYSAKFLSQFYHAILLLIVWPEDKLVLNNFRNFCLELLHLHCQEIVRGCLYFCSPKWDEIFKSFYTHDGKKLLSGLSDIPIDNTGRRDSTENKQKEFLTILHDISIDHDEFEQKFTSVKYCLLEFASHPLICYSKSSFAEDTRLISRYLHPDYFEQLIDANIFEDRRSLRKHSRLSVTSVVLKKGAKKILNFTFFAPLASHQLIVDSLTRRISGISVSATLARLLIKLPDDENPQEFLVIISKEITGLRLDVPLKNNMDQFQMIEQKVDPCYFTLKVIETLLILPLDDGPENVYASLHTSPVSGKSFYLMISKDTFFPFKTPVQKSLDGQEIVQVKSILFCFQKMSSLCNPEAVQIFLSLSPFELLRNWLSCLQKFEETFFSNESSSRKHLKRWTTKSLNMESKIISSLYRKFMRLQEILNNDLESPTLKNIDLVSLLEPRLATYYSELLLLHSAFEAWKALPVTFRSHIQLKRSKALHFQPPIGGLHIQPKKNHTRTQPLREQQSRSKIMNNNQPVDRLIRSCNLEQLADIDSFTCAEGIRQLEQMKAMFSEITQRRKYLLEGNIISSLHGLKEQRLGNLSSSREESAKMSYSYVMEQVFMDVNWNEILEAIRRFSQSESIETPPPDYIQKSVHSALQLFVSVENLQVLHFRFLPYVDDALLRKFLKQSRESLRVLDLTGAREITSSAIKIIARYCEVLDELYLNQLNWTSFDGNSKFSYLRKFYMNECPNLSRFHLSLKQMPSLEHLCIEDCIALKKFTHSTLSTVNPYGSLNYISFKRDDSLSFSSFYSIYKGLSESGYTVCSTMTAMRSLQANNGIDVLQSDETTKPICIKVDECITLFTQSRKKTSDAAAFLLTKQHSTSTL